MDQNQTPHQDPQPTGAPADTTQHTTQAAPTQALPNGDLTSTHKVLACASYFVFFLPVFFEKEKHHPFVVHHMNQGFGVFLIHLVYMLIAYMPFIYMFSFIIGILSTILVIIGIISAAQGHMKKLPLVGDFKVFHT